MQIKQGQTGVTLIELMIVVVITSILLLLAIPAFLDAIDRNRLRAVTDIIYGDLQFAKFESIKRNEPLTVDFTTSNGGATWCYGFVMGAGASCDCTENDPAAANACVIDPGVLKVVKHSDFKGVVLTPSGDFVFDNVRGTVNAGDVTLDSPRLKRTQVKVYVMGNFRKCSPIGSTHVSGYSTSCP